MEQVNDFASARSNAMPDSLGANAAHAMPYAGSTLDVAAWEFQRAMGGYASPQDVSFHGHLRPRPAHETSMVPVDLAFWRLTAENDQLRAQMTQLKESVESFADENRRLRAEVSSISTRLQNLEEFFSAAIVSSQPAESPSSIDVALDGELSLLVRHFVTAVRALSQTRQVLLEDTEEGPRLWIVIEAEPFERGQREPIYQAQGEALRRFTSVDVSFRLVNISEFGIDRVESLLPSESRVLWRRPE